MNYLIYFEGDIIWYYDIYKEKEKKKRKIKKEKKKNVMWIVIFVDYSYLTFSLLIN